MFIFKGTESTQYLIEREVKNSILPPVKNRLLEISTRHGAYDVGHSFGVREIEIEVVIKGESNEDLQTKVEELADWLYSPDLEPLVFSDSPHKTYFVRIDDSTDLEQIVHTGFGTLKFIAPVPFGIGEEKIINLPSGDNVLNIDGNYETFPVYEITLTENKSKFTINSREDKIEVNATLNSGSLLVIDTNKGIVTLNGTLITTSFSIDSDFFAVKNGDILTVDSGATVQMIYRGRWK